MTPRLATSVYNPLLNYPRSEKRGPTFPIPVYSVEDGALIHLFFIYYFFA